MPSRTYDPDLVELALNNQVSERGPSPEDCATILAEFAHVVRRNSDLVAQLSEARVSLAEVVRERDVYKAKEGRKKARALAAKARREHEKRKAQAKRQRRR